MRKECPHCGAFARIPEVELDEQGRLAIDIPPEDDHALKQLGIFPFAHVKLKATLERKTYGYVLILEKE